MLRTPASRTAWLLRCLLAVLVAASGLPAVISTASAAEESVTLSPEIAGNQAVRAGQFVVVSGTVPVGDVTSAALVAVERDGGEVRLPYDENVLGQPSTSDQFLRSDDGQLTGRLVLGCTFADPAVAVGCSVPGQDVVAVRLDVTAGGAAVSSPALRVDYTRPSVVGYRLIAPDRLEVRFSEPVRGDDNAADFTVEDPPLTVVTGVSPQTDDCTYLPASDGRADRDGCTRVLSLLLPLSEDATPLVHYDPEVGRPLYQDDASNLADRSSATTATRSRAVDALRPAVPRIDSVAGRTPAGEPASASSNEQSPVVQLSNLTAGQEVRLLLESPAGVRSATPFQVVEPPASPLAPTTALVTVPALVEQGAHVVSAEARDTNGNLSTDASMTAPRADGSPNPVTYVLDSVAPLLLSAVSQSGSSVEVVLSEAVTGPDRAGDWTVTAPDSSSRPVTGVTGDGARRSLAVSDVPAGSVLRYAPQDDQRYADAAGNALADDDAVVGAVGLPVVTVPAADVVTQASSFVVSGTAEAGRRVDLLPDGNDDGVPDSSAPVGSAQLASGETAYSITVPLATGAVLDLVAVATDGTATSGAVDVPTITQDSTVPALDLTSPTGGEVLPGGAERSITWTHDDANPGTVAVEYSPDGGSTWTELTPGAPADAGSFAWTTPQTSSDQGRVRLTARDLAGNLAVDVSEPFVVDALTPSFTALTTAPRRIELSFDERVTGPLSPLDFRVDGTAVTAVTETAGDGATVLVLELATAVGPDSTPQVEYAPALSEATGELVDRAGQGVAAEDRIVTAVDGIRPAVPSIDAVDGQEPSSGRVTGDSAAPGVEVSGLLPDNAVWVERVPASGAPEQGPETTTAGETATVQSPVLPSQGDHVLRVVARDPAGNLSTDADKTAGSADGSPNPVTYQLDGIVPVDVTAPELTLSAPTGGEVLAGGVQSGVQYTTSDANPDRLLAEVSLDGGRTWTAFGSVDEPTNGDGEVAFPVPDVDTDAARVRLTAVDQAGNTAQQLSGTFTIDAVEPVFTALTTSPDSVRLSFSEPVTGPLNPLDFRVAGTVVSAVTAADGTGSASQAVGATVLVLDLATDIGGDATPQVEYAPALSDATGELVDRAGQGVVERVVTAADGIRPAVPTVEAVGGQEPAQGRVSGDDATPSVSVSGLLADNTVWVQRESDTVERGAEATSNGGTAVLQAPSLPDGSHVLRVVARDPAGNLSTDSAKQPASADGTSNPVTYALDTSVPTVPVDVTAPSLTLRAPTGGEVLAGGAESAVEYTTSDENPGRVLAEISTDGGRSWSSLGTVSSPANGDGELGFTVPDVDTSAAQVRVTAVDQAGNSTNRVSGAFVIDAIAPSYTALTTSPTTVLITFSEPVSGPVAPGDFRVDGQSAQASDVDRPGTLPSTAEGARTLVLTVSAAFGGDDTPTISYSPSLLGQLVDRVGQGVVERVVTAVDGIRPPVPTLASVDGVRPSEGRVSGDDGAPQVVVDGLVTGHTVRIERLSGDQTVATGAPVAVHSTQATARAPRMSSDGEYVLRAVAVDPAGNLSTDTAKKPASPDGGPSSVVYALQLPAETPVRDVELFACPPDQVQPAGFVDTAQSTFRFEIDCLAGYGFTRGVTSDRYVPAGNVTRAQMAIFVSRLARYGSVPLDTSDAGFTDLGAATPEARDAINALANLGVVKGVSPGRYAPAGNVSRAQMASFLARLQPAVGEPFPAGSNAFDDDAGDVHESNINAIAADGIVQGVSPRTYAPSAPITRQQMAGFLVRYVDGRVEAGEMESVYQAS